MKIFKYFLIILLALTIIDFSNFMISYSSLENEANLLTYKISKEGIVSDEILEYIETKEFDFIYDKKNYKIGDMFSFTIEKEQYCLFQIRTIKIDKTTILLGY